MLDLQILILQERVSCTIAVNCSTGCHIRLLLKLLTFSTIELKYIYFWFLNTVHWIVLKKILNLKKGDVSIMRQKGREAPSHTSQIQRAILNVTLTSHPHHLFFTQLSRCLPILSPENGKFQFWKNCVFWSTRHRRKSRNQVILCVIRHCPKT